MQRSDSCPKKLARVDGALPDREVDRAPVGELVRTHGRSSLSLGGLGDPSLGRTPA